MCHSCGTTGSLADTESTSIDGSFSICVCGGGGGGGGGCGGGIYILDKIN